MRKITAILILLCLALPAAAAKRKPAVAPHTDISGRATFIAVEPCRLVDTRDANGPYGGPAFSATEVRTYDIPAGPCADIPVAAAYSLSFAVVGYSGPGWITAFPAATTQPNISTVNYGASGPAVANAAVVAATSGSISVFARTVTHVIIDINGYFIEPSSTIMSITAGTGLSGGGSSGGVPLSLDFGGNGSATTASRGDHTLYTKIIIVSPVGTESENGDALLAAIAGITGSSATNPFLVKLEPGIYRVGLSVTLPQYVHLEGSGTDVTMIIGAANPVIKLDAAGGEVRMLAVEGSTQAISLIGISAGGAVRDVVLTCGLAFGGVEVTNGTATLDRLRVDMDNSLVATGVSVYDGADVTLTNSSLKLNAQALDADGIYVEDGELEVRRTSIDVTAGDTGRGIRTLGDAVVEATELDIDVQGSNHAFGIRAEDAAAVTLRRSTIRGHGDNVFGVHAGSTNVLLYDSQVDITGNNPRGVLVCTDTGLAELSNVVVAAGTGYALFLEFCGSSAKTLKTHGGMTILRVDGGILRGTTAVQVNDYDVRIGNAQLDGNVAVPSGTIVCATSYNGSFVPLDTDCVN